MLYSIGGGIRGPCWMGALPLHSIEYKIEAPMLDGGGLGLYSIEYKIKAPRLDGSLRFVFN